MGAIVSGVYGATRGAADARKEGREEEGFAADQAIRTERLNQEKTQAPLRTRALELGVQDAEDTAAANQVTRPLQQEAAQLNVDIAKMNLAERKELTEKTARASKARESLLRGVKIFHDSANPQALFDELAKDSPDYAGPKAKRNDDNSITLTFPDGKEMAFKEQKWPDGSPMSPDQALISFAGKRLDPLKAVEDEYQQRFGIAKEQTKQTAIGDRQVRVEGSKAAGRPTLDDKGIENEKKQIKPVLDSVLKTTGVQGSFALGYGGGSHDAALRPMYEEALDAAVSEGKRARQSVRGVLKEVRDVFGMAEKKANALAEPLIKKGINPRDNKAMQAEAAKGNKDVAAFNAFIQGFDERSGLGAYLLEQVKSK